jgi:tetratricopeptide (TPR) repeat protein
MRLPATLTPMLALLLPLVATAATPCTDTCRTLVTDGNVLSWQGQPQKALEKFQAAMAAVPDATAPLLAASTMLLDLSWRTADETAAARMHAMAESLARQAVRLAPGEAMAQDVLRQVLDGPQAPSHQADPDAAQALRQAEILFAQRHLDEARVQYEAAIARDPLWPYAWIGAGDTYYAQQDWPHAEERFRHATDIDPHNAQAWRYLSDSLLKQGKRDAAEQAIYAAIAANPGDRNNWSHLASLRAQAHLPLTALNLHRGSTVALGADGHYAISIDAGDLQSRATPDMTFALLLAASEINARLASPGQPQYDIELGAWRLALRGIDEANAKSGQNLRDPALLHMQALARDGQLAPALLILAYRPAYRAPLDAWLAAHPGGVKAFIDRYGLQP